MDNSTAPELFSPGGDTSLRLSRTPLDHTDLADSFRLNSGASYHSRQPYTGIKDSDRDGDSDIGGEDTDHDSTTNRDQELLDIVNRAKKNKNPSATQRKIISLGERRDLQKLKDETRESGRIRIQKKQIRAMKKALDRLGVPEADMKNKSFNDLRFMLKDAIQAKNDKRRMDSPYKHENLDELKRRHVNIKLRQREKEPISKNLWESMDPKMKDAAVKLIATQAPKQQTRSEWLHHDKAMKMGFASVEEYDEAVALRDGVNVDPGNDEQNEELNRIEKEKQLDENIAKKRAHLLDTERHNRLKSLKTGGMYQNLPTASSPDRSVPRIPNPNNS